MTGRMRIYPERSVSGEFEQLGTDGFTGTLNDRQFAQLGVLGLTGALADRFAAWDGSRTPIDFGGGQTEELTDPTETVVTFTLTGGKKNRPAANDIVFALVSEISASDVSFGNISGYTKAAELFADDDYNTNMALYYKVMTATPDTSITVPGSANKRSLGLMVFENVDDTTPLDIGIVSQTAINTGRPSPAPIYPINQGSRVLVCGGSGAATADASAFTSSQLLNFITRKIDSGSGSSHVIGMGVLNWNGNTAVFPQTFGGNTTADTASWGAFTVALRARGLVSPIEEFVAFTSGSGTWTVPPNVNTIYQALLVGAGGGSAATTTLSGVAGGGGGGGEVLFLENISVTPGQSISYSVGAGVAGANGADTTFGANTAVGGGAGAGAGVGSSGASGGGGGIGGAGSNAGGAGTDGNAGGTAVGGGSTSYGGGGGGGAAAAGANGDGNGGGAGGSGRRVPEFADYGDGGFFGGGGGGAVRWTSAGSSGLGGLGGGGDAGAGSGSKTKSAGRPGDANTGGGAGSAQTDGSSGGLAATAGGSGVIILRLTDPNPPLEPTLGESATSGDMNSGGDNLKLSGDMTDGNDLEKTRSV